MTEITVRQRNQITIPHDIAAQAGITTGTVCDVFYANGTIMIRLPRHEAPDDDIMRFAGVGKGLWGSTTEEVDRTIRGLRDSWDGEHAE